MISQYHGISSSDYRCSLGAILQLAAVGLFVPYADAVIGERAVLFVGKSGEGKTTLGSRLVQEGHFSSLMQDSPTLYRKEGVHVVRTAPNFRFRCDLRIEQGAVPLAAVVYLGNGENAAALDAMFESVRKVKSFSAARASVNRLLDGIPVLSVLRCETVEERYRTLIGGLRELRVV